jgi:hypothetical protein
MSFSKSDASKSNASNSDARGENGPGWGLWGTVGPGPLRRPGGEPAHVNESRARLVPIAATGIG